MKDPVKKDKLQNRKNTWTPHIEWTNIQNIKGTLKTQQQKNPIRKQAKDINRDFTKDTQIRILVVMKLFCNLL